MDIRDSLERGCIRLRSRIVMPPLATEKSENGYVTAELCEHYAKRAKNSLIGLIITEHMYVAPEGRASRYQLSIADDSVIEGLKRLTDTIHGEGNTIKVFAQINHAGGKSTPELAGEQPVSASVYTYKDSPCRELSVSEIHRIAELFAAAARRARLSGYDGVEIHSAHGYILNQFYSPLVNQRRDEYGASSLTDRLRLHKEIIEACREEVGHDFPIAVRLGGCDYQDGGSTEEEAVEASELLCSYGVDLIDVSGGMNGYIIPGHDNPGYFREMSAAIKKAVNVPVLTTGGITTVEQAEELLCSDCADLIGVGRALLKDPEWGGLL